MAQGQAMKVAAYLLAVIGGGLLLGWLMLKAGLAPW